MHFSEAGVDDGTLLVYVDEDSPSTIPESHARPPVGTFTPMHIEGGHKYDVGRLVATGGMGVVYEAKDIYCQRTVAVKVLLSDDKNQEENHRRFIKEARITSRLEHPNIIPVHELGKDDSGNVFYSMKFVHGMTLGDILNKIRQGVPEMIDQYPLARLLTIYQKVCDAVAFAHAHDVLHRDLKPGNIMIGDYGEVLVLDWGLARALSSKESPVEPVKNLEEPPAGEQILPRKLDTLRLDTEGTGLQTIRGTVLGTPGFMAPEQLRKEGLLDARTDIFAMGAILYSILTLTSPVREREVPEILKRILGGEILPPAAYNKHDTPGRPAGFPHLPGGKIPEVLSDMVMKCMHPDPEERYQTIREVQEDLEAYQNGQIWHLVVDDDFSQNPAALEHWEALGCIAEIVDGELRISGGELQLLLLKREISGDVRIEFDCRIEGAYLNDIAGLFSGVRGATEWETSTSGYAIKFGAYTNTLNVVTRCDRRIWSQPAAPLVAGATYHLRMERHGARLRMVVNNQEICSVTDPEPLTGSNRTVAGLLGWIADKRIRRIRVYVLGSPWKSDILETAERHLQRGHLNTAMDLFEDVLQSLPDEDRRLRAMEGYHLAQRLKEINDNLPGWRERLAQAWPGVEFSLTLENYGLCLKAVHSGIESLEPVRRIPLSYLDCYGNRIRDLSPLRGMPLVRLTCTGNPIESLEPLRGMPLVEVHAENCRITRLEPLRSSPLSLLYCSENKLDGGLEDLRGLSSLSWLHCADCGLSTLEPITGLSLTRLLCDANHIESLEPVRGMPLTEISCNGNRIASLEPLRGIRLNGIYCRDNRIESLEPLKDMPLSTLYCSGNHITSLDPLKDMPLSYLICGANRLKNIGPMIRTVPKIFLFDCETISTHDLEWIHQAWSRDFRHQEYAVLVETLLAARRMDLPKLRAMATTAKGRRYLFVPRFVRWEEARKMAEKMGGHLAVIRSEKENAVVESLFPYGGVRAWIGLHHTGKLFEWITGEPLGYKAFISELQANKPGPRVIAGRFWFYEMVREARHGFVVEWND